MKRRKLWKTGEDGLCCSSSAIQTRLGPSSLPEERSEIPIVLLFLVCCRLPPNCGKRPRYIDRLNFMACYRECIRNKFRRYIYVSYINFFFIANCVDK